MSFTATEVSDDEGRPIAMYAFTLGAATWRYTSSDNDVVMAGYKWTASAISDEGLSLTGEAATDTMNITCPSSIAPVQLMIGTPPSQSMMLSIYHYHEGGDEMVLSYIGELLQVDFPQPGVARFAVDTLSVSLQRDGLRLGYQRSCPYALYDAGTCNADKTAHKIVGEITESTINTITVSTMFETPNGLFDGGFIEWDHPQRGREYRGIETQVAGLLTLFGLADGLYYGLQVTAYHGCDRRASTCSSKFNNLDNYGGVPDMPGKSPFDGDPVF